MSRTYSPHIVAGVKSNCGQVGDLYQEAGAQDSVYSSAGQQGYVEWLVP